MMKQLVDYQREVDKGELTTIANFEKVDVSMPALVICQKKETAPLCSNLH